MGIADARRHVESIAHVRKLNEKHSGGVSEPIHLSEDRLSASPGDVVVMPESGTLVTAAANTLIAQDENETAKGSNSKPKNDGQRKGKVIVKVEYVLNLKD